MTKSTRNLLVLVGTVTILTLALFAVGPVLAQSGTASNGQNAQGSNTVVLSTNETLGTLVSRYNLSGTNLRDFLSANSNLPLVPGQRVIFPAGFNVNIPTTGQGTNSSQGQGATSTSTAVATSTSSSASSTGTPVATTSASSASSTETPVATTSASSSSSSSSSSNASGNTTSNVSGASNKAQTYVVQPGDTLGTILNMMGFQASSGTSGAAVASSTPVATMAATVAATPMATTAATTAATPVATTAATVAATPVATMAATVAATPVATMAATVAATPMATTAATVAATTAAGSTASSTSTPVATTAAGSTSSTTSTVGGPSDAQLLQFVRANSTLRFGLVVSLPAGIPATGSNSQGKTGTTGTTGTGTTGTTSTGVGLAGLSGQRASAAACSTSAPKGFGYYKVRGGDSLQSISKNFGVPVSRILELNSGSAFAKGNIILLPGVEAPGMWDVKSMCPGSTTPSK